MLSVDGTRKRDAFLAALSSRPQTMGILNITPDSFSDGGRFSGRDAALAQADRHVRNGVAIIDIGAESTRPGFEPISAEEEASRLGDVLAPVIAAVPIAISIDTTKAVIAREALECGAVAVNDQWGLQGDPEMAELIASFGAIAILMHNRHRLEPELDIIDDLCRFFERSLHLADRAGIARRHIILDPGIGFAKSKKQNIEALGRGVSRLCHEFGLPVLVGASRKSLFASLIGATRVDERLPGTLAAHLCALRFGARLFRVHDSAEHRDALAVTEAIDLA